MGEPLKGKAESLVSGGVVGGRGEQACKRGWGQILGDMGVQAETDFPSDYRGAGKGMQGLA